MKCHNAEKDLFRYLERATSFREVLNLRLHIAFCSGCRSRLIALKESNGRIASAVQSPVDTPDLTGDVMEIIRKMPSPAVRRSGLTWRVAFAAAMIIGIAAAGAWLSNRTHNPPPTIGTVARKTLPADGANTQQMAEIAATNGGEHQTPKAAKRADAGRIQPRHDKPIRYRHKPNPIHPRLPERTRIATSKTTPATPVTTEQTRKPAIRQNYVIDMVGIDIGGRDKANYVINEINTGDTSPVEL